MGAFILRNTIRLLDDEEGRLVVLVVVVGPTAPVPKQHKEDWMQDSIPGAALALGF